MPAGYIDPVLDVEDLRVFFTKKRLMEKGSVTKAVDGVSVGISKGEVLALVGESGSGKTTLGRAAIGLVRPTSGRVLLRDGEAVVDVGEARGKKWKALRKRLQIIFQDPFSSVDPNMRVRDVLRIPLQAQGMKGGDEIDGKILAVVQRVGLPQEIIGDYVFQLSGGQRQRIGIARVLLFDPAFVVADEPVSMLDASLKADILRIIEREASENGTAFLLITHEMAVAKAISRRIGVMYLGKLVEVGPAGEVVRAPLHPYTQALIQASPAVDPGQKDQIRKVDVVGEPPRQTAHPAGCKFHPRCPYAMDVCKKTEPEMKEVSPGHFVACWLH